MRLAFIGIILVYTLLNFLIGRQLYDLLKVNKFVFWGIFIIVAYSPLLARFGVKGLDTIGNYWMVFFYYSIFIVFIAIIIKSKPIIISSYALIILVIFYGVVNANRVVLQEYNITIPKPSNDLRIVLLADVHIDNAKSRDYVQKMVERVNGLIPDLVFFAGDIFDDRDINALIREKEHLKNIQSKYGTYGVLGNHEYYSGNLKETLEVFKEANIRILRDEYTEIEGIYIVGREDASQRQRKALADILQGVDKSKPIFLLDHQPVRLDEPKMNGVDLQLSGHTHKGQFFPNQLITRRIYEVDYGHLVKDTFQIIVSSGYGTWGPPVRIGTQSEVVVVNVGFAK